MNAKPGPPTPEGLNQLFRSAKWKFEKCLEPHMTCAKKPIRAHSIQNARVFDLLSHKNHVLMFRLKLSRPHLASFRSTRCLMKMMSCEFHSTSCR